MTDQEQNFVSRQMDLAADLIGILNRIKLAQAEWNNNDFFNQITDQDLASISGFAHLTAAKLSNSITAITAVETALGDDVTGQLVNLIKLRG